MQADFSRDLFDENVPGTGIRTHNLLTFAILFCIVPWYRQIQFSFSFIVPCYRQIVSPNTDLTDLVSDETRPCFLKRIGEQVDQL